ncbi:MAG: hypothetical protein ACFFD4_15845 [Candidatus Odinarchaeota archaeon]
MAEEPRNVRISGIAWELLRWSKYKLGAKSYSDAIIVMSGNIAKTRTNRLQKTLSRFDEKRHRVKVKLPKNSSEPSSSRDKPKTILLDPEARDLLEMIKLETNEPAYTFSDAIEFLVTENDLLPDHLKKKG